MKHRLNLPGDLYNPRTQAFDIELLVYIRLVGTGY